MTIWELVGDALKRLVAAGIVVLLLFGAVALLVGVCGLATALSGHG